MRRTLTGSGLTHKQVISVLPCDSRFDFKAYNYAVGTLIPQGGPVVDVGVVFE